MVGYTVTIRLETPFDCIAQKPVAIGIDKASAKSIHRHLKRKYKDKWSDMDQSGIYVMSISREFCSNHADFEHEYNAEMIDTY